MLVDGLADIELSLPDSVTSYTIPKGLSCQSCHKHEDGWVLGFNGLQLEMPPEDDSAHLARLAGEGVFPSPGVPPFTSIEALRIASALCSSLAACLSLAAETSWPLV